MSWICEIFTIIFIKFYQNLCNFNINFYLNNSYCIKCILMFCTKHNINFLFSLFLLLNISSFYSLKFSHDLTKTFSFFHSLAFSLTIVQTMGNIFLFSSFKCVVHEHNFSLFNAIVVDNRNRSSAFLHRERKIKEKNTFEPNHYPMWWE